MCVCVLLFPYTQYYCCAIKKNSLYVWRASGLDFARAPKMVNKPLSTVCVKKIQCISNDTLPHLLFVVRRVWCYALLINWLMYYV